MDRLRVREQRHNLTLQQVGVTPVTSLIACIYNASVRKANGLSIECNERLLQMFSGIHRRVSEKELTIVQLRECIGAAESRHWVTHQT